MLRDTSITKSHLYSYHFIPLLLAHPRQDAALRPSQGRASWQECGALRAPERTRGRRLLLPPPAGPSPRGRLFSSSLPALPAGTSLTSSFLGRLLPGSPAGLFPPCLALSSTLRGRRPSNAPLRRRLAFVKGASWVAVALFGRGGRGASGRAQAPGGFPGRGACRPRAAAGFVLSLGAAP